MAPTPSPVVWIKVDKPSFDLIGVILGSLNLTGAVAGLALVLGLLLGLFLLRRKQRERVRLDL